MSKLSRMKTGGWLRACLVSAQALLGSSRSNYWTLMPGQQPEPSSLPWPTAFFSLDSDGRAASLQSAMVSCHCHLRDAPMDGLRGVLQMYFVGTG